MTEQRKPSVPSGHNRHDSERVFVKDIHIRLERSNRCTGRTATTTVSSGETRWRPDDRLDAFEALFFFFFFLSKVMHFSGKTRELASE